jgi:hypothetical protein
MHSDTAVVFNGNDAQLPMVHMLVSSIRDPDRGDFDGDIWLVSTGISDKGKQYLDQVGIQLIEDSMQDYWNWPGWQVASSQSREYRDAARAIQRETQNRIDALFKRPTLRTVLMTRPVSLRKFALS